MEHIQDDIFKNKKVKINYPTNWKYKVIGKEPNKVKIEVEKILKNKTYKITNSKTSSSKKYTSLEVTVLIGNENERLCIFDLFKNTACIQYVL